MASVATRLDGVVQAQDVVVQLAICTHTATEQYEGNKPATLNGELQAENNLSKECFFLLEFAVEVGDSCLGDRLLQ